MVCPKCGTQLPEPYYIKQERQAVEYAHKGYKKWWEANKERVLAERAARQKQWNKEYYEILLRCLQQGIELTPFEQDFIKRQDG